MAYRVAFLTEQPEGKQWCVLDGPMIVQRCAEMWEAKNYLNELKRPRSYDGH